MPFFEFPEDARWNADRDAVEFSVVLRPTRAPSGSPGGSSSVSSISRRRRSGAWWHSTSRGPGSS